MQAISYVMIVSGNFLAFFGRTDADWYMALLITLLGMALYALLNFFNKTEQAGEVAAQNLVQKRNLVRKKR